MPGIIRGSEHHRECLELACAQPPCSQSATALVVTVFDRPLLADSSQSVLLMVKCNAVFDIMLGLCISAVPYSVSATAFVDSICWLSRSNGRLA